MYDSYLKEKWLSASTRGYLYLTHKDELELWLVCALDPNRDQVEGFGESDGLAS